MGTQGFCKRERLCGRSQIERLYTEGEVLKAFPFSVRWMRVDHSVGEREQDNEPCRVMIVVPKRRFRHAVDRNRLKRLTRECYRRLKQPFYDALRANGIQLEMALVYMHREMLGYDQVMKKMERLLQTVAKEASR